MMSVLPVFLDDRCFGCTSSVIVFGNFSDFIDFFSRRAIALLLDESLLLLLLLLLSLTLLMLMLPPETLPKLLPPATVTAVAVTAAAVAVLAATASNPEGPRAILRDGIPECTRSETDKSMPDNSTGLVLR